MPEESMTKSERRQKQKWCLSQIMEQSAASARRAFWIIKRRLRKLNSWERVAQFQFMDEMMKDDEKSIFDDDDEIDTFADAGLDYDELEFMDPDERREVLEDAGLDPDEFDF